SQRYRHHPALPSSPTRRSSDLRPFVVSGTETAERIGGALVSAETFDILGMHPTLGRGFVADDDRIGAAPVVLLSDGLWNRRYGRSEEHTSELQSRENLVCRLLL